MSNKKISKEAIAAIIAGLFGLGAALIGSWDKFQPKSIVI